MTLSTEKTVQTAARILAQGFVDDPMLSFIFPDSNSRLKALIEWFQLFVKDGYQRGFVTLAPDEQGAIIWYPANVQIFDSGFDELLGELAGLIERFAGLEAMHRFEQLGKAIMSVAPETPHCEVFWLALLPQMRGQGLGGNLLQPVLHYADANQVGCYLVSSNPRNIGFYERYRFQQRFPLWVENKLLLTGMWRDPQPSKFAS